MIEPEHLNTVIEAAERYKPGFGSSWFCDEQIAGTAAAVYQVDINHERTMKYG